MDFVFDNMKGVAPFSHKTELLKFAVEQMKGDSIFEFGVFKGKSIRTLAAATYQKEAPIRVYGFDSFRGLPESWTGSNEYVDKKHFDVGAQLPHVPSNVTLIP